MSAEGFIKALNCGLIIGFSTIAVIALVTWLVGYESGLWLALGVGVGLCAISTVLLYFLKFRPTEEEIARRVDSLGFEERMVTMLELSNDDSYIARRQREDAKLHLDGASAKLLKLKVSTALVSVASVSVAAGVAMSTVNGLAIGGVIPGGSDLIDNPPQTIAISYFIEEGGIIEGEADQIIEVGTDPEPVTAIADEGWVFTGWDDGWEDPYRFDVGLEESYTFTAVFERLSTEAGGDIDLGPGDGDGGQDGDDTSDKPNEGGANGEGGEGNGEGEGGEEGGNGEGGEEGGKKPSEGGQGGGAGGRYEESNQIIDGSIYYGTELDKILPEILEMLASDTELTAEEKAFLEKYFASL